MIRVAQCIPSPLFYRNVVCICIIIITPAHNMKKQNSFVNVSRSHFSSKRYKIFIFFFYQLSISLGNGVVYCVSIIALYTRICVIPNGVRIFYTGLCTFYNLFYLNLVPNKQIYIYIYIYIMMTKLLNNYCILKNYDFESLCLWVVVVTGFPFSYDTSIKVHQFCMILSQLILIIINVYNNKSQIRLRYISSPINTYYACKNSVILGRYSYNIFIF
jgi:hypothetical protein